MGGLGSGERLNKKTTVEECLKLDMASLWRGRVIQPQSISVGELVWTNSTIGERILTLPYCLQATTDKTVLHLITKMRPGGSDGPFIEAIPLSSTAPHFGGVRWWFVCPLVVKGVACHRRVRTLYLPPRALYSGCRACFDLTYESAQTHDQRVYRLMKDPAALVQAIKSENPYEKLRGLQAYGKIFGFG